MTLNARLVLWILLLLLAGWQFVGAGQWWDRLVGMGLVALLAAAVWLDNKKEAPAQQRTEPQAGPDLMPWSLNLLDLLQQVLPVWGNQSLLVQQQTEDAIVHLNTQFADLQRLLTSGQQSQSADQQQQLVTMIRESERKLLAMTEQLEQAQQNRLQMLGEIQQLAKVTDSLQSMTSEVGDIAAQTNLLALNAAIEAARAGESGRGFAVVATEVRALSNRSSEAGQKIRQRVADITQSLTKTVADSEQQVEHEQMLVHKTAETISSVLNDYETAVQQISASNSLMQQQAQQVQVQLSDVVMHLQFQDRTSQILGHVMADIGKLEQQARAMSHQVSAGQVPDFTSVQQWLERLKKTYTTLEQVTVHTGKSAEVKNDDITFF